MWSSAEVHFAQRLASNEKKTRDKAVKKLKMYLHAKSSAKKDGGFSEDDLLKIWKGLHYCMWMQDKPIIQEELADTISSLLHIFPHVPTQFQFLKVFFQTEAREWNGIDRWRLDKFMMLIRRMLREAFQMLKRLKFVDEHVDRFMSLLFDSLLSPPSSLVPDGLKIHLIDIYLEELVRIGTDNLNSEQAVNFLQPFLTFMQKADNIALVNRVISHLLNDIQNEAEAKILKQKSADDNEKDEEDRNTLEFDLKILANKLYELGSSKECLERNRTCIYACVRRFQDLHDGVARKQEEEPVTETDISKEELNKAVRRLVTMEKNLQRKRKRTTKEKKDSDTSLIDSSKKRVSFNMKKNKAVGYQESLNVSPVVPFNPDRKPEQGILKSPVIATCINSPNISRTPNPVPRLKGQKLSSYVSTPMIQKKKGKSLTRARAADFF